MCGKMEYYLKMQNSVAKKLFAVGVAASTVLMGLAPFAASAAVHSAGTNVMSSDGTVWMITASGTRRAYTSAGAFLSYGFNSWSTAVTASAEDLALPVDSAGYIPPQDGSVMCSDRGSDKGTCYVITGGQKAGFTSAAVFTGLGYSFSNAKTGDLSWMAATTNIGDTTSQHRPGTLVQIPINGNPTVVLVGNSGYLGVPDLTTFNSWGYSFKNVVVGNAADKALVQSGVMAARTPGQLSPTSLAGGVVNPPSVVSGSVSASLASDNPAASTLAVSTTVKSVATLAKFTFNGSGTVTQLQVKRVGVSADSDLSNVYLFNGNTRLTDAASVGGDSLVTFSNPNGLFTVSGSMTISVVVEIPANTSSGKTIGIQLTSFTVANGSPASVSLSGNLVTTSSVSDLAYATFGTVTPSNGSYDPAVDTEVFRSNVTINNRDMTLSRMIVRNIGTIQQADLNNFRLRIDGTQVAQTQTMDANGYVTFGFSPVTLKAGTRVFSILADIINGSSRNFQFQIRNVADVYFVDSQYGVATAPSGTFPVGSAVSNGVNSGTMTVVKATNSPSGNVTDGSSDVVLARYTVTAYGEAQKIETVTIGATSSDATVGSLRNGRVLVNGVQYGSTATLAKTTNSAYTTGGTSYTLNYTVQPGTPVTLEIHADMFDNDGVNNLGNSDTVTAVFMAGSSNVQKMVSLGYNSVPSVYVLGNSLTDVTGSAGLAKNATYANQTAPLPQTGYKVSSFNLVGSTSEDITVSSVDLAISASSSMSNLNNVKMMVDGNMYGTIKSTVAVPTSGVGATSTFSGNYTLKQNSTVLVEVYADMVAPSVPYTSDWFTPRIAVNGTTVNSSASVVAAASGQKISVGSASLALALDPSTPVAAIVASNQTKTAAVFKFTSANDQYTISELVFTLNDATNVTSLVVKDSSGTISTQPGQSSITMSNLNIVVPANSTKLLTVDLVLGNTGYGAGTSGANAAVTLSTYKSAPASTGTIATTSNQSTSGNAMYVYKAIPTITNLSLPTGTLAPGATNTISKFTVSAGGTGTIGWTHLVLDYATSSGVTGLSSVNLYNAATPSTAVSASTSVNTVTKQIVIDTTNEQPAGDYLVKATVTGGSTTGDYVNTYIPNLATSPATPISATTATSTGAGLSESFVWTDLSAQSHSFTTYDWNTDYLVKNIPTDTQNLVK